jgi:serpin B
MLTKRRLTILGFIVLAAIAGFVVYSRTNATACAPMSGTKLLVDPELVKGNTDFAFKLYRLLAENKDKPSNFVFSSYSIAQLMAMLDMGADGETELQIARALNFTLTQDKRHSAFQALNNNLVNNAQTPEGTWCNANALWVAKDFPLNPNYLAQVKSLYSSEVQSAEFASNAKGAVETIDKWVQDQTKGRIKNLFKELSSDTALVLANAVYFKNNWEVAFPKSATRDDNFTLLHGQTITVPMMKLEQKSKFPYWHEKNFQVVELPYKGKHVSMIIILPEADQFDAVEAALDANQFEKAIASLVPTDIKLSMPRFQFQYELPMIPILKTMGITDAFNPNLANFGKMTSSSKSLYVAQATHKAFISVDEQGAEAAAVSGAVPIPISVGGMRGLELNISRPFLFAIRDQETGAILFMGRVLNPLQ